MAMTTSQGNSSMAIDLRKILRLLYHRSGKGHFSQLVWKSVTQIGCAATFCGRGNTNPGNKLAWGWMYVCEYAPKGNIGGGYLDNVLPAVG